MTRQQKLFALRSKRLAKLITLKAPRLIIEQESLLMLAAYGIWRPLLRRYNTKIVSWFEFKLFRFWHKGVLRKTDAQIEKELMATYDLSDEQGCDSDLQKTSTDRPS